MIDLEKKHEGSSFTSSFGFGWRIPLFSDYQGGHIPLVLASYDCRDSPLVYCKPLYKEEDD